MWQNNIADSDMYMVMEAPKMVASEDIHMMFHSETYIPASSEVDVVSIYSLFFSTFLSQCETVTSSAIDVD